MSLSVGIKKYLVQLSIVFAVFSFGLFTIFADTHKVIASDNNFTDGITVDSKLDTPDANVGNNICDDGSGNCTLRAAIEESNATTGTQTITFNISGTADFTNGGQNGYTIQPTSGLPQITDTVNIDAYTQPGAQANTAIAPNPLNGRLLVELNGDNAGVSDGLGFFSNSNNSTIKGLVINGFDQGNAIWMLADGIVIRGNYIGTNPAGNSAKPNVVGVNTGNSDPNAATGVLVGGLNPADRNLISGNTAGTTGTASYPGTDWIFQGNYIGVAADGLTPIDNSTPSGSGQLSVDNCTGVIIGGNQTGAINVLGASLGHGIAPHEADNLTIEGNFIGLGYDGTTVLGNVTAGSSGAGIALTDSDTVSIKNNRFAGWTGDGVAVNLGNSNVTVDGNNITDSGQNGIHVGSANTVVSDNTISTSTQDGIYINSGASGNSVAGNTISTSTQDGIYINSGASGNSVAGNTISTSTQNGISVNAIDSIIASNTIINNTIYGISVEASDNQIYDNIISNNQGPVNMLVSGTSAPIQNLTIQGNKIGTKADGTIDGSYTQGAGILMVGNVTNSLIGGSSAGDGNIIAGNNGAGIANSGMDISGFGVSPNKISIIGNSIFGNNSGSIYGFAMPGLGIDHYVVNLDGSFVPQSTTEEGATPNDTNDTDTGPNNYMNFPVLNSATQTNDTLALNYDLDAADSPTNQYRVEFFANDTADTSGNGEGQTYLGVKLPFYRTPVLDV